MRSLLVLLCFILCYHNTEDVGHTGLINYVTFYLYLDILYHTRADALINVDRNKVGILPTYIRYLPTY